MSSVLVQTLDRDILVIQCKATQTYTLHSSLSPCLSPPIPPDKAMSSEECLLYSKTLRSMGQCLCCPQLKHKLLCCLLGWTVDNTTPESCTTVAIFDFKCRLNKALMLLIDSSSQASGLVRALCHHDLLTQGRTDTSDVAFYVLNLPGSGASRIKAGLSQLIASATLLDDDDVKASGPPVTAKKTTSLGDSLTAKKTASLGDSLTVKKKAPIRRSPSPVKRKPVRSASRSRSPIRKAIRKPSRSPSPKKPTKKIPPKRSPSSERTKTSRSSSPKLVLE